MDELGDRIRFARKLRGLTQKAIADHFGIDRVNVTQWEGGTTRPDLDKLPELAELLGVTQDWLLDAKGPQPGTGDGQPPIKRPSPRPAPNASPPFPVPELPARKIPVYGVAVGGSDGRMKFNGERLDMVGCPPELANVRDAYAVYVSGDSMVPSFKPGQIAWVNPHLTARPGDDVIVQLHPKDESDAPEGFIKELVRRTPSKLVVKQYNPEGPIEFDHEAVLSVHVVVFASRR